jgi:endogenous inhibitor of DNA gyrase (YacG/DUF329 family)
MLEFIKRDTPTGKCPKCGQPEPIRKPVIPFPPRRIFPNINGFV